MLLKKNVPISFIVGKIKKDFIAILIFSIVVGTIDQIKLVHIPMTSATILGTAISLLLAFRTAQAYDRWWEARKIWGEIVNNSRTLIRELQIFIVKPEASGVIKKTVSLQSCWCYCLGESLRKQSCLNTLEKYLNNEQIKYCLEHKNIPNAILNLIAQEIQSLHENKTINDFQQIKLAQTLSVLCDCMGKAERIKNTIFPLTYSIVLRFLIYLFAFLFPLCLTDYPFYIELILNILISCSFFLIENTATYKQDPFEGLPTDVAITQIAQNIEINLKQMINDKVIPQENENIEGFYVL